VPPSGGPIWDSSIKKNWSGPADQKVVVRRTKLVHRPQDQSDARGGPTYAPLLTKRCTGPPVQKMLYGRYKLDHRSKSAVLIDLRGRRTITGKFSKSCKVGQVRGACAGPPSSRWRPAPHPPRTCPAPTAARRWGGGSTTLVGQLPIETKCPDPPANLFPCPGRHGRAWGTGDPFRRTKADRSVTESTATFAKKAILFILPRKKRIAESEFLCAHKQL
jgi:hypothetical protein